MKRGRILQSLSKLTSPRIEGEQDEPTRREDQINPPSVGGRDPASGADTSLECAGDQQVSKPPAGARRGRGARIISQLESLSLRSPSLQDTTASERRREPDVVAAGGENVGYQEEGDRPTELVGSLSRSSSSLSKSSVVSQQFAEVEQVSYKAQLPKTKSTAGVPQKLSVNYMTFSTTEGKQVEEYHVNFHPDIESIRLRYALLRSEVAQSLIGPVMHWNGTNLYLPKKLPDKVSTFIADHPVTNTPVKVILTFIKTPPENELLPFYNSLMHKVMNKLRYVIINRQHYSPLHKISIEQHRLEVWPGWITSIQKLDGGIKLSVDASFRVLRLQTVRDIMLEIKQRNLPVSPKEAFECELIGSIIMTRYNNRAYRIDGIDLTKKPSSTFFSTKENKEITYIDYMRKQWNVEVRDPGQPMILHRPKPKRGQEGEPEIVYLIPELCVTTGLTDEMRANYNIMKAIDSHTKLPPDIREGKYTEFLKQLHTDERARTIFEDWNLSVKPSLDLVEGRRLNPETVIFGNDRSYKCQDNVDWTRAATSGPMFKTIKIENWVLIHTERDTNSAQDFMNCLKDVSRSLGITFHAPRIVKLPNDNPTTYVQHSKREVKRTDQMVVLLTPGKSQREDRYSACKRLFSCEIPVPCQFIRCGTISNERKIRAIVQKIAIQILAKVGGQPWAMKFPLNSFMVVGLDTYHDTIDRKKSCVGFVASMNAAVSEWYNHTFFQQSLEEIGQKLSVAMVSAIKRFHELNSHLPEKIIVYRDGVGDGQLDAVLELEVAQTINAIKFYMRDCHSGQETPKLSYVIVQKRINAKLSRREQGSISNPLPGTFLDHTITHPEYNDFYLVSQHVNQGTVSPTKYVVLSEMGTLKLEHHQKLAYKMTHMYYNWCGTIRVPAPCQYAHKLAYLTGQNIRQQASEKLEDKLFFL